MPEKLRGKMKVFFFFQIYSAEKEVQISRGLLFASASEPNDRARGIRYASPH